MAKTTKSKRDLAVDMRAAADLPQVEPPATGPDGRVHFGTVGLEVRDDLTERDRLFVPDWDPCYIPDDRVEEAIAVAVGMDIPLLLTGATGCGKNLAVAGVASALNQPLRRINLHGDVRASDVLGSQRLTADPERGISITEFVDGVAPDAMRNNYWLLLDEIDACPAQVAFALQSLLEPGHRLTLAGNHGEVVIPGPAFRIFATANTLGRGDDSGIYAGTHVLNEATLNRFIVVACDYLPEEKEAQVLVARSGLPEETVKKMVACAARLRPCFGKECDSTFSTRHLVAWARIAARLAPKDKDGSPLPPTTANLASAYELAVGNRLNKEDREFFAACVQREMGLSVLGREGQR